MYVAGNLEIWMRGTDTIPFPGGLASGGEWTPDWICPGSDPTGPVTPRGDMGQMCEKSSAH